MARSRWTVVARGPGWARLKVTLPGHIRSNQGINVPRTGLSVAALTDKDLADLEWTAKHDVEYVGLSFVRKAEDVALLRSELQRRGSRARIIAKIEKPQALANLDAIIAEADGVMVARGDLGVELDVVRVPAIQKQIIDACHRRGCRSSRPPRCSIAWSQAAGRPAPRRATSSTPCSTAPTP